MSQVNDLVGCLICEYQLDYWKPHGDAVAEHERLNHLYPAINEEGAEIRAWEAAKAVIQSPRDTGFFDPSPQLDLSDLRLFHDVDTFAKNIKKSLEEYRGQVAFKPYPSVFAGQHSHSAEIYPKTSLPRRPGRTKGTFTTCTAQYHKCIMCSASFSSPSRLPSHCQTSNCNKACCKHCEGIFESNDQLHGRIRNRECTSARKSNIASKSRPTPLAAREKATPDNRSVVEFRCTTTAFNSADKSRPPLELAVTSLPPVGKVASENPTQPEIESGAAIISGSAS